MKTGKPSFKYSIFALTTSKATLFDKKILLAINIPIIDTDDLSLFETIPIPFTIKEKLAIIIPSSKQFLLNNQKQELTPITEKDLEKCKRTQSNKLICSPNTPTIIDRKVSCELSLIRNSDTKMISQICEFQLIPKKNYMVQIHQNNSFYCVIENPIRITEICPKLPIKAISITHNGIISIKPGCSIYTDELIFTAPRTIYDKEEKIINPLFNMEEISEENILKISGNLNYLNARNYSITLIEDNFRDFDILIQQVKYERDHLKETNETNETKNTNNNSTMYYTLGAIAILIFSILAVYIQCFRPCFTRPT